MNFLNRLGLMLVITSIVMGASGALLAEEPGPFEKFFRALRHGFNEPQHHSQPHHSSNHKQTAGSGTAEGADDQSSVAHGTSGGSVTKPPNDRNTKSTSRAITKKGDDLPYGTPVAGRQGFVTSPFSPNSGYIDVRGFAPGTPVKDPYSGKVFLTP